MALEQVLAPAGLFLGSNPHAAVPPGAMTVAENVVIRRPGIVEPRPGFVSYRYATLPAGPYRPRRAIPFESGEATDLLVLAHTGSAWLGVWRDAEAQVGFPTQANAFHPYWARHVSARGNLYLPTTGP